MRLIDCFMPLIGYVVNLRENLPAGHPDFEQVQADLRRLFSQSESLRREEDLDSGDFDRARFMVCAWADEAILASDWDQRERWQREQLQRLHYNTTDAGVEAFERLNDLGFHQGEVREVFYLCLSLGFKGRFVREGDEFLLEQLKTSNLKLLMGSPGVLPSLETLELFPEATARVAVMVARPAFFLTTPLTALALAGPVVLFWLMYLVYHFALSGAAGKPG
jgi:type VI secretion system protein ImpK